MADVNDDSDGVIDELIGKVSDFSDVAVKYSESASSGGAKAQLEAAALLHLKAPGAADAVKKLAKLAEATHG